MHPILKEILLDIERLEPFPHVAVRVLELSMQEGSGPRELVEVIKTDAGITSKVLTLVNSAGAIPPVFLRGCGLAPGPAASSRATDWGFFGSRLGARQYQIFTGCLRSP